MPPARPRRLEYMLLDELRPADENPKAHDLDALRASMHRFGMIEVAAVLDERTGQLISGHGRLEDLTAAEDAGLDPPEGVIVSKGRWKVPVLRGWASADEAEAEAALVAVNETTIAPGWREADLAPMLERIAASRSGLDGTGYTPERLSDLLARVRGEAPAADGTDPKPVGPTLADRFLVPPFSVLDARQGYWQDRKRQWLALGIRSELGRPENLLKMSDTVLDAQRPKGRPNRSKPSDSGNDPRFYAKKRKAEEVAGRPLTTEEFLEDWYEGADAYTEGTSVFDPVLCELAYRWWAGPGHRVLDPFAGGSVRGIVAAFLGLDYTGIELRPEQVAANVEQLADLGDGRTLPGKAAWREGDAAQVLPAMKARPFDLLFSCPPYFDLERYSDDPLDLSAAGSYGAFLKAYEQIIAASVARLADDAFAVWVVGEIRDKAGDCRGFIPDTIRAFERAGMRLYNDAVLVTAIGSLALRAGRIFAPGRKLGRAHQYVLVFAKGDARAAAERCGPIEVGDPAELFGEVLTAPEPT